MQLSPSIPPARLLEVFGPGAEPPVVGVGEAVAYARGLAEGHYENFHVLSGLVPEDLRDDFAAVYAYCRWSDDLADELANREQAIEALAWWRGELSRCFEGRATHPVFVALLPTIERRNLVQQPFEKLLDAFVQDQYQTRYESWEDLIGYCRGSADPVGQIVLALDGLGDDADLVRMSDATCTALQLANHWQDVRRDLLERDRIYLPLAGTGYTAETLRDWADRGEDPAARIAFIKLLRPFVEQTSELFAQGQGLPAAVAARGGRLGRVIWLFGAGGRSILKKVSSTGCTTLWERPRLGKIDKASLLLRAKLWRGS